MSDARDKLAFNLKTLRLNKNKNIHEVANEIGLAYSYLYNLEMQKVQKNPSMDILDKLAAYYDVEVYELFL